MNRVFYLDIARAISILLVVFTHSHELASVKNPLLVSLFYSIDRIGVPIFLMISGGLILQKLKDKNILDVYIKRIPQFIVLLVTYSILTSTIKYLSDGANLLSAIMKSVIENNGITNNNEYPGEYGYGRQLWYMYTIIQLYIIAPFVAIFVNKASTRDLIIFTIICVFFNQFKGSLIAIGFGWNFLNMMGSDFTGAYLSYFITGYIIVNRINLKTILYLPYLSAIIFLIPIASLVLYEHVTNRYYGALHWYTGSIQIYISSIGLFLLLISLFRNANQKENKIITLISSFSFGIYLSHYAFIIIIKQFISLHAPYLDSLSLTVIYFIASLLSSVIFTSVMFKTRFTRYFVS